MAVLFTRAKRWQASLMSPQHHPSSMGHPITKCPWALMGQDCSALWTSHLPQGFSHKQSPSSEVVSPWWTSLPPLESNKPQVRDKRHFAKLVSSARSVSLKQQSHNCSFGIWSGISFIRVCGYNVKRKYYCILLCSFCHEGTQTRFLLVFSLAGLFSFSSLLLVSGEPAHFEGERFWLSSSAMRLINTAQSRVWS